VARRRIQPKAAVELETVALRLPAHLVRAVEQYAKYLGGSTDRTHVITQAIEIALAQDKDFQKALAARPTPAAPWPRATAQPPFRSPCRTPTPPAGPSSPRRPLRVIRARSFPPTPPSSADALPSLFARSPRKCPTPPDRPERRATAR
jgi:hypothetical protein